MNKVFIGLGSNLSNPSEQIDQVLNSIGSLPETKLISSSSLYASKPLGPQDQPDFVNAVCLIETNLSPDVLLKALQQIEIGQGRVKKRHWGERLIDLDILTYGDLQLSTESLTIPHSQMHLRDFVLVPMLEIAPDASIPGLGAVKSLIDKLEESYIYSI